MSAAENPETTEEREPPPRSPRPRRGCRRLLSRALLALLSFGALAALWQWLTWPDVAALAETNPESTAFIDAWQARQRAAGRPGEVRLRWVPYGRISGHLKHAVVVAEDIDFFTHDGFAWEELKKAVEEAREEGKALRGASTITQQLAKNLWLSPSRNPWRKVKEALLTRQLEQALDKRRILELYLNVVELGPGIYGAEAASRHYFGKGAAELSPREAAALAGALPKPSQWHPGSKSQVYQRRVERILGRMEGSAWVRKEL